MDSREEARMRLLKHNIFMVVASVIMGAPFFWSLSTLGDVMELDNAGVGIVIILCLWAVLAFLEIYMFMARKHYAKEYSLICDFYRLSEKYGFPTDGITTETMGIAHNSRITYYCENGAGYISDKTFFHFWKKDNTYNFLEMPKEKLLSVPEKDLISCTVTGDKRYITKITGGGGGGSSLGGAVVGGMLGGATGAVIGSRKATQPITTDVITMSNQKTIVNCMIDDKNAYFVFTSGGIYDKLIELSPSKELNMLNTTLKVEHKTDNRGNVERLKELREMLDNDLISSEEFEEKRKEILSEL